jgi:hypothetical protein
MDTGQPYHVVGIENATRGSLRYEFRWGEGKWESFEIDGKSRRVHWWRGNSPPKPQIRFDCSSDPGFQEKIYGLEWYVRHLGKNMEPDFDRDAREYVFRWKDDKTLELSERR